MTPSGLDTSEKCKHRFATWRQRDGEYSLQQLIELSTLMAYIGLFSFRLKPLIHYFVFMLMNRRVMKEILEIMCAESSSEDVSSEDSDDDLESIGCKTELGPHLHFEDICDYDFESLFRYTFLLCTSLITCVIREFVFFFARSRNRQL